MSEKEDPSSCNTTKLKAEIKRLEAENAELKIKFSPENIGALVGSTSGKIAKSKNDEISQLREQLRIAKDALTKIETYSVLNDEYKSFGDVAKQALAEMEAIK